MASRICEICGAPFTIKHESRRYFIGCSDLVCSRRCINAWIKSDHNMYGFNYTHNNFFGSQINRGDFFSSKLRMSFRSLWELKFAEGLVNDGFHFEYESVVIHLSNKVYIPDFFIPRYSCFIEVKGRWGAGARKKFSSVMKLTDSMPILLVPWTLKHYYGYPKK